MLYAQVTTLIFHTHTHTHEWFLEVLTHAAIFRWQSVVSRVLLQAPALSLSLSMTSSLVSKVFLLCSPCSLVAAALSKPTGSFSRRSETETVVVLYLTDMEEGRKTKMWSLPCSTFWFWSILLHKDLQQCIVAFNDIFFKMFIVISCCWIQLFIL